MSHQSIYIATDIKMCVTNLTCYVTRANKCELSCLLKLKFICEKSRITLWWSWRSLFSIVTSYFKIANYANSYAALWSENTFDSISIHRYKDKYLIALAKKDKDGAKWMEWNNKGPITNNICSHTSNNEYKRYILYLISPFCVKYTINSLLCYFTNQISRLMFAHTNKEIIEFYIKRYIC